jgi:DamX protein
MFKTSYRHKEWYVLLHGLYSTRQQALAALEKLPLSLRQDTQPWARTLASVQKALEN